MADSSITALPLADFHRDLGGRLVRHPRAPVEIVEDYGSARGEAVALTQSAALVDRSWHGGLELMGEDRSRFLSGLITADVAALAVGGGCYGFLTSAQGRVLADASVMVLGDRLRLELPAGAVGAVADHLSKYVVMDRVEVQPASDLLPLSIIGPRAKEVLAPLTELPGEPFAHAAARVLDTEVEVENRPIAGQSAYTLWVSAALAEPFARDLLAATGVAPAGFAALEAARVEAGVPAFGADFTDRHFPQESGLEAAAVSYSKGCYLGQEIVARIHYRGQANHEARRLWFEGDTLPAPGSALLLEDREVGVVGSVALAPSTGRPTGIAVLHRNGSEPGTKLAVEGGGVAEVAELAAS